MIQSLFMFCPGCWEGAGEIELTAFDQPLQFSMRWHILQENLFPAPIECYQEIQIKGYSESLYNQFVFTPTKDKEFGVEFENVNLGSVIGKGIYDDHFIGWELRDSVTEYEGFEVYDRVEQDQYILRAAYTAADGMRTEIRGSLWKAKTFTITCS